MSKFIEVPKHTGIVAKLNVDHIRFYEPTTISVNEGYGGLKKLNVLRIWMGEGLSVDTTLTYNQLWELITNASEI